MEFVEKLAHKLKAPVLTTFKAKGQISDRHPLGAGVLGRSGTPVASFLMNESDLLVAWGDCSAYSGASDPYLPFRDVMGMLTGDLEARWTAGTIGRDHARRLWTTLPLVLSTLLASGPSLIGVLLDGDALLSRVSAALPDRTDWNERLGALARRAAKAAAPERRRWHRALRSTPPTPTRACRHAMPAKSLPCEPPMPVRCGPCCATRAWAVTSSPSDRTSRRRDSAAWRSTASR